MTFSPRLPRGFAWGLVGLTLVMVLSAPAWATEHYRYLPADTRVVVTVNVTALPESDQKAWQQLGERMYKSQLTPELEGNKQAIREVTSITVAMPYAGWPGGMILLRGKVNAKLLAEQARRCAKLSRGAIVELKPMRGQPMPVFRRQVTDKEPLLPLPERLAAGLTALITGSEVYFAAVDDETLILTVNPLKGLLDVFAPPSQTMILNAIKARFKTSKSRASARILALLKKQDSKAWMTCAVLGNSLEPRLALLVPDINLTFQRFEHAVGSVREGTDVEMTLVAKGKNIEQASELEKTAKDLVKLLADVMPTVSPIRQQKEVLEEMVKSIEVSRKNEVVTVTGKIAATKLRMVFAPVLPKKE